MLYEGVRCQKQRTFFNIHVLFFLLKDAILDANLKCITI